ncbi:YqkE family protein [Effusibacillus dendaii]|uniref:YqkE family protein n=1 Tax=Effusibacillus dendaii TaxID=2743772 RepID=UPI001909A68B|nr:YqkE family protein [Effusibacillus dendaii]
MAKKNRPQAYQPKPQTTDKPATLKDLLNEETLAKLKSQQAELQAEEDRRQAEKRLQEEAARKAEQKRLENDFEYLLKNSNQDWRKYK